MSGEFSAVAATNQNSNPGSAFAAAVERAKQVAAKITPTSDPQKRPLEDLSGEPEAKKPSGLPTGIGGGYTNSSSSSNSSAAQVAAAQAAAVAARVAAGTTGNRGVGVPNLPLGPVSSKDIKVPDKMVGLSRGGEQIMRLQAESGCKIQMAPDSGGTSDRMCTLTGNSQSIAKAEDLISQIVQSRSREMMPMGNGSGSPNMNSMPSNGSRMSDSLGSSGLPPSIPTVSTPSFVQVEIMVPGPKVGLIIGKGGETIKQLQERSGAKMVVIQDGPSQEAEKPLRISGDPQKVEHAKALVYEFMAEKEQQLQKGRGGGGGGGGGGGRSGGGGNFNQSNSRSWDPEITETTVAVPAGKCGVIIGKGGETIRQINQQTGAHCEIDRRQQTNMQEKVFVIKGSPEQIEHVKRLFSEKLNMNLGGSSGGHSNNYGMGSNMPGGPNMSGVPNFNGGSPWPSGSGSQSFQQPWPNSSQGQNQHQQMPQHNSSGASSNGNVPLNSSGQPDYSAQWVEYYRSIGMVKEASIIEEQAKANKPGQPQIHSQAIPSQVQLPMQGLNSMQQGQQISMGGQQQPSVSSSQQQQGQGDQSAGAPDYSAQWAQYYRSLGKVKEAEAIEAQMKAKQSQPNSSGGMVSTQPNSASVPNMYNQQAALAANQYGLGGFPTAASAQGYYGAGQPTGGGAPYAYPNYGAYPQSNASDSH